MFHCIYFNGTSAGLVTKDLTVFRREACSSMQTACVCGWFTTHGRPLYACLEQQA